MASPCVTYPISGWDWNTGRFLPAFLCMYHIHTSTRGRGWLAVLMLIRCLLNLIRSRDSLWNEALSGCRAVKPQKERFLSFLHGDVSRRTVAEKCVTDETHSSNLCKQAQRGDECSVESWMLSFCSLCPQTSTSVPRRCITASPTRCVSTCPAAIAATACQASPGWTSTPAVVRLLQLSLTPPPPPHVLKFCTH